MSDKTQKIPTWKEYEDNCGYPQTYAEYIAFIRLNFTDNNGTENE